MIDQLSHMVNKLLDVALGHFLANRLDIAENICRQSLDMEPANLEAMYLMARIAAMREDHSVAADLMEKIFSLRSHEKLFCEFNKFLCKAGRSGKSASFFRDFIVTHPDNFSAWYYLGLACLDQGNMEAAHQAFVRAINLRPSDPELLFHLALAEERSFDYYSAIEHLHTVIELAPKAENYCNHIASMLKGVGKADEAVHFYLKTMELSACNLAYFSNYLMNFLCTTSYSPEFIFSEHRRYAEKCCNEIGVAYTKFNNDPNRDRRLKIGYLSCDFYRHPVAFFIEPIITLHNREVLDVYIYSNVEKPDEVTEQFKQRPSKWRDIYGKSNEEVCSTIVDDGIDILVDLNGHTKQNRLPVFAKKPAPVQVTWLGYANTTGLPTIDYRLTDGVADPSGMTDHLYSEKLYRLQGSFLCYHPPLNSPNLLESPFVANSYITFSALNNFAKVNLPLVGLWARVLKKVPGSKLMLKENGLVCSPSFRADVLDWFAQEGITCDRLILQGRTPTVHMHLDAFSRGDIALDSSPYNGTTTTCEALWMGVPVVTLAGSVHVSRVSASLLTSVGVPELIANTEDEFVEIAARLAGDHARLQAYRQKLRGLMSKSSLMDVDGFVRKLEQAYRDMWQRWCQSQHGGDK